MARQSLLVAAATGKKNGYFDGAAVHPFMDPLKVTGSPSRGAKVPMGMTVSLWRPAWPSHRQAVRRNNQRHADTAIKGAKHFSILILPTLAAI